MFSNKAPWLNKNEGSALDRCFQSSPEAVDPILLEDCYLSSQNTSPPATSTRATAAAERLPTGQSLSLAHRQLRWVINVGVARDNVYAWQTQQPPTRRACTPGCPSPSQPMACHRFP